MKSDATRRHQGPLEPGTAVFATREPLIQLQDWLELAVQVPDNGKSVGLRLGSLGFGMQLPCSEHRQTQKHCEVVTRLEGLCFMLPGVMLPESETERQRDREF